MQILCNLNLTHLVSIEKANKPGVSVISPPTSRGTSKTDANIEESACTATKSMAQKSPRLMMLVRNTAKKTRYCVFYYIAPGVRFSPYISSFFGVIATHLQRHRARWWCASKPWSNTTIVFNSSCQKPNTKQYIQLIEKTPQYNMSPTNTQATRYERHNTILCVRRRRRELRGKLESGGTGRGYVRCWWNASSPPPPACPCWDTPDRRISAALDLVPSVLHDTRDGSSGCADSLYIHQGHEGEPRPLW